MINSGKEGAMACTVAVEDTIVTHYTDQIREIIDQGKEEEYQDFLKVGCLCGRDIVRRVTGV